MSGFTDLHCHLLPGVDDGAKTLEDALEMARALVELGFSTVAPSPHARPEYASAVVAKERLAQLEVALAQAAIPLSLAPNAENFFLEDGFFTHLQGADSRQIGSGGYVLVEAPYTNPLPTLTEMIFRIKLKGVTPLIAHPERCAEFEKKGRAAAAVHAGACLQLDVGALTGRYGPGAKKLARTFLEEGLYAVGATDLHGPVGAREWVGKALEELRKRVGEPQFLALMRENPARILRGESLET